MIRGQTNINLAGYPASVLKMAIFHPLNMAFLKAANERVGSRPCDNDTNVTSLLAQC